MSGARQRMRQVGMGEAQIAAVERSGQTQPRVAITAPIGGVVTDLMVREGMAVIIIGHVTKDGSIAGPRTLEHLVDVVLTFEGDRHSGFRMVRATKNRFGPADEVGCFEMSETGIVEVPDPSGLFTTEHTEPTPGTCVTVTMEGRRPLLAEIQALVAPSPYQSSPRRTMRQGCLLVAEGAMRTAWSASA